MDEQPALFERKPMEKNFAWQLEGVCRSEDPEMFFLPYNIRMSEKRKYIERAKAVCRTCPVIEQCLQYALDTEEQYGIWGGLSENERRVILRRRSNLKRVV